MQNIITNDGLLNMLNNHKKTIFGIHRGISGIEEENIKISLYQSDSINGRAFKRNDIYHIEIPDGSKDILVRFYDIILQKNNNLNYGGIYFKLSANPVFNEENSVKYRDLLVKTSYAILLAHELGHILHGHVDYKISKEKRFDGFFEFQNDFLSECTSDEYFEDKILEVNADSFSICIVTGWFTDEKFLESNGLEIHNVVIALVFSIQTMFNFLGLGTPAANVHLKKIKHLPKRFRLDEMIDGIYSYADFLDRDLNINKKDIKGALENLESYYHLYARNFDKEYKGDFQNNQDDLSEKYLTYRYIMELYWRDTLINKLQNFSYIKLYKDKDDFIKSYN